jgi:hypothetical protein
VLDLFMDMQIFGRVPLPAANRNGLRYAAVDIGLATGSVLSGQIRNIVLTVYLLGGGSRLGNSFGDATARQLFLLLLA